MVRDPVLRSPTVSRPAPRLAAVVRGATLLAVVGALTQAACSGGTGKASATDTTVATTAVTVPTTTTTTSTLPPTTVYQPSAPQPSADEASGHLISAWMSGDRAAALTDATPAAVSALFAQPYPSGGVQFRSCSTAVAGPSDCTYRNYDNDSLIDLSAVSVPGGWMITAARVQT